MQALVLCSAPRALSSSWLAEVWDPDDLSLVSCRPDEAEGEMREISGTVGDATAFVGRSDDPARDFSIPRRADITELTSTEMSRLNPIDTSNADTDVDSNRPDGGFSERIRTADPPEGRY